MASRFSYITVIVGLYALIGIGIGLIGVLGISWLDTQIATLAGADLTGVAGIGAMGVLVLLSSLMVVMVNPLIAALVGSVQGRDLPDPWPVLFSTFVGTLSGFLVMFSIALLMLYIGVGLELVIDRPEHSIAFEISAGETILTVVLLSSIASIIGAAGGLIGYQLASPPQGR